MELEEFVMWGIVSPRKQTFLVCDVSGIRVRKEEYKEKTTICSHVHNNIRSHNGNEAISGRYF